MSENTNDRFINTLLDDRYQIEELIGEGGMAVVYRATDNRLNRQVAVKIMRPEFAADEDFKRRFCSESQAVAMLSHPNIMAVYDVSQNEKLEYIVMELINGITLKQYLDRKGAIGWRETLHFAKQIARALVHAHERGIIHRDIKPQNIMLLRDGTIKVADFGIAALENEASEMTTGQAIGSIHYIAPEQARGELPNVRGDVYSLGIVMYEMLTGALPYTGDTLSEIALKHLEAKPVPPHEIVQDFPPPLEGIILKAMDPNADERYQSAAELLDALEEFTESQAEEGELEEKPVEEVMPIRSVSEMTRGSFLLRRKRAGRVSFFSGSFLILAVAVFLFAGLWNFWLKDIFPDSGTVTIPDFIGSNIADISNNTDYAGVYNFLVSYVPSSAQDAGIVISQNPAGGRSVAAQSAGINISLTVNAGAVFEEIPNVVGSYYRDAVRTLEALGFVVEIGNEVSETVEEDYCTDISPAPGDKAVNGSTVYLTVSAGRELTVVSMPLLIGLAEEAAVSKINAANLTYGGTEYIHSDTERGIVLSQSAEAFSEIEEHAKVLITVSAGPEG